jgi:hypothetical protein
LPGDQALVFPLAAEFAALDISTLPHCFVHGDLITTNVLRDKAGGLWIVDFAVSNFYPRIQELAVLACNLCFDENDPVKSQGNLEILLKSYQEDVALKERELRGLPIYVRLAHAMHLLEANYEQAVRGNNTEENVYFLRQGRAGRTFMLPPMTQVEQYLAVRTLNELFARSDDELLNKTLLMGGLNPTLLARAANIKDFMRILTHDYPNFKRLLPEFESTAIVGESIRGMVIEGREGLERLFAPRRTSVGSEPDPSARFQLLQIIVDAFIKLEEPISLGRLKFLNPYIPALAGCPEDRRLDFIQKIFAGEYPFHPDNSDQWMQEIHAGMSS